MLRRLALGVLAVVGLLAAPADAARIERSPEFVDGVHRAIARGVEHLRAARTRGGGFLPYGGYPGATTALAYHTLRVCGVRRDDPDAVATWEALRREYATARSAGLRTYSAALFAMAVAEHGDPLPRPEGEQTTRLSAADAAWMRDLVAFLEAAQNKDGGWSYGDFGVRGRAYDHSNTQYALLGLKAAARCGVPVQARTWKSALTHFLALQEPDGPTVARYDATVRNGKATRAAPAVADRARGWGYVANDASYGSMTAGAVASVVICRSELLGSPHLPPKVDKDAEASIRDGLAWIGANFTVRTNPGNGSMAGPGWHYYYLYAVERAGVLAAVEWMADRDWYGEGAEYLVGAQRPSGAWSQWTRGAGRVDDATADTLVTTCFALLFLKKGTMPVQRGALTQAGDDSDIRFDTAARLGEQDFSDFLDLVLARWRRAQDETARRRLLDGATSAGPRIVLPLLVRMDGRDAADRASAHALLRHATAQDFGFDPDAPAEQREEAVTRWQRWWLEHGERLRYDAASRRLVAGR